MDFADDARVNAEPPTSELFRTAMAALCSGVAVVTARRPDDGAPCGLVATSVSSFSGNPPSLLISVGHASRCHHALVECEHFGVHLLKAGQEPLAHVFAGLGEDKFAGLEWEWDEDVPWLDGPLAYLRCRRSALFELYDHSILIGDVTGGRHDYGAPLVYLDRRMDWTLRPGGQLPG
jgi:flavin reductase (DIM6/NTAB) family NADH-FMN oxidoreductase RutF